MSIPKNFLKLGLLVLIIAAIRMAVLVKNKKGLNEFIAEQEVVDFTTHDIHPLFAYL